MARYRTPLAFLCSILLFATVLSYGQTASTGLVRGTVTDPTGGVVPGATVELTEKSAGVVLTREVNEIGQYVFPNVRPGEYTLKVTAVGFRTFQIEAFSVEVTKSYQHDVKLELGGVSETVSVTAEARAELQTVDSTIGNVISKKDLPILPIFTRQINEILLLQPGATRTGQVSGAREDQNTFSLDGIDVSNQNTGGTASTMFLGVDSIEEFRVGTANPNASFGRAAGGQISLVARRGTNQFHGSAYWYHQNDNLNANSWDRNRTGLKKPEMKDNRFGASVGGPIFKDKTFFFGNYEGRRFPRSSTVTRNVPTDTLKQGILRFRDASGTINSYNLATSTACGTDGKQPCDPRGLGLSPSVSALWAKMPAGNDATGGDGLNTTGFTGTFSNPLTYDFTLVRLDHNITSNWRVDASARYYKQIAQGAGQVSIVGGQVKSVTSSPTRQNMFSFGLNGSLTPKMTADFRLGWVRDRNGTEPMRPNIAATQLAIPGTNTPDGYITLDMGARGGANSVLSEPIDIDTQVARKQANDNRNYQVNGDFNWIKGTHMFQFGARIRDIPTYHTRDDKVLGSLGALVAQLDAQLGTVQIPNTSTPPVCSSLVTSRCVISSDLQQWQRLFASTTGMVDNVTVLAVRDGNFNPLPYGSMIVADTHGIWAPEMYFQDVWRIRPSLTVTVGATYGFQTPPKEELGRYTVQVYKDNPSQLITSDQFFQQRRDSSARGDLYNPDFAFNPVDAAKTTVFNVDWNNIAPRAAVAWNPSFDGGFMGKLFGNRKTVIRAGYGMVYDRQNTVQSVMIPSLGIGFAQTLNVNAPVCNASGGGTGCNPASTNMVLSTYRVGQDGTIPRPVVPQQTIPASPTWCRTGDSRCIYPEVLSFQVDPSIKIGQNHAVNFTIQRQLPLNQVLEIGYVGRYANSLPQSMNLGQTPINYLDKTSGQTFAQAFDGVAKAIRAGTAVTAQPWFENLVPGGTTSMATAQRTNFLNGNVNSVFQAIDLARMKQGLASFNNYMSQMYLYRASTGYSNYNGMTATLRRSRGSLTYDLSYTFSKAMDQLGAWQNSANVTPNSFDLDTEYGPSSFDYTHIFNGIWTYSPPYRSGYKVLDKIIQGWQLSGIFTTQSGSPLTVTEGSQVWGGAFYLGFASGAIPTTDVSTFGNDIHTGIAGSSNIGTNGDPAKKGSGLNLFANPEAVFNSFRRVELARDGRAGRANPLRGPARWNLDMSVAKRILFREATGMRIGFDFFNIFNKVDFNNPTLNLTSAASFGVITGQYVPPNRTDGSRWIQVSLRFDF